jgi:hypothetical protein
MACSVNANAQRTVNSGSLTNAPLTNAPLTNAPLTEARWRRYAIAAVTWTMLAFLLGVLVLAIRHMRLPLHDVARAGVAAWSLPIVSTAGMLLAVLATVFVARRWPRGALVLALLAVVGVRLAVTLAYEAPQVSDWHDYGLLAAGIRAGQPPFADRPMGWPAMLAAAWSVFGPTVRTGTVLNVALAGLTGLALAAWLRMLSGTVVAAVGVMAFALLPSHVLWTLLLGTEVSYTLAIACLALALTWLLRPGGGHSRRVTLGTLFAIGVLLGWSYWIRSTSIVLMPFIAALPLAMRLPKRDAALGAAAVIIGVGVLLAPLVAWNAAVLDRVSFSNSLYTGWQLYDGNNAKTGGAYNAVDRAYAASLGLTGITGPYAAGEPIDAQLRRLAAADDALLAAGIHRLESHGTGLPRLLLRKVDRAWGDGTPAAFFALSPTAAVANRKLLIAQLSLPGDVAWVLALAGTLAWYWTRRRNPGSAGVIVAGVTLLLAAGLLLVEVQPRYHEYVVPLLLGLAAIAWVDAGEAAIRGVRRARVATARSAQP